VVDGADTENRDPASLGEVAIVHDYLNQRGGAEKVVLELADMWPQAPIYTSLYRPQSTFPEFAGRDVRTSLLERLPIDKGFRDLFPLYPAAFRSLGAISGDVVIASSSGWAHMARAAPNSLHVVYCHTPARWLYRDEYLNTAGRRSRRQMLIAPVTRLMRRVDQRAAARADLYIANSQAVQRRIRSVYGIESTVVYPPVDTERFVPRPRGERLLVISRLLPYKRVDLVVRAASQLGIGLDVVGDGPMRDELRRTAGAGVSFHGSVSENSVVELLESCSAVCVAGAEDFGIVAVEAQAAGKPVLALGRGGALETVEEGVTGVFFHDQTEESLAQALKVIQQLATPPEVIAAHAARFSRAAFRRNLLAAIAARIEFGA
jgi:glycosyltransferase involved in cell wall biosynthesis